MLITVRYIEGHVILSYFVLNMFGYSNINGSYKLMRLEVVNIALPRHYIKDIIFYLSRYLGSCWNCKMI